MHACAHEYAAGSQPQIRLQLETEIEYAPDLLCHGRCIEMHKALVPGAIYNYQPLKITPSLIDAGMMDPAVLADLVFIEIDS